MGRIRMNGYKERIISMRKMRKNSGRWMQERGCWYRDQTAVPFRVYLREDALREQGRLCHPRPVITC